jgi:arginine decarboxylase-like protein
MTRGQRAGYITHLVPKRTTLTVEDVKEIKRSLRENDSADDIRMLAVQFGVTARAIRLIKNGDRRADVSPDD